MSDVAMVFGGSLTGPASALQVLLNDTWVYQGDATWTWVLTANRNSLGYDGSRMAWLGVTDSPRIIFFGGANFQLIESNETWRYQ